MTVWSKDCTVICFMFNKFRNFIETTLFLADIVV